MPLTKINPAMTSHCVGNAALFAVAQRLSLLGWNVLLTSRNTRGPDLYFMDRDGNAQSVQVKGVRDASKKNVSGFGGASKAEADGCQWWIGVRNVGRANEEFFVMTKHDVLEHRNEHGWLQPPEQAREAWDRIGFCPAPPSES
jgi:hypothetical protein